MTLGVAKAVALRQWWRRSWRGWVDGNVVCGCIVAGLFLGAILHGLTTDYDGSDIIHVAEAATTTEERVGREVRVIVHIDWTKERIEQEIRDTFPEDPETAVKIARCESGLRADIQSHHILNGVREPSWGVFQIHKPSWHQTALRLGYDDYKTDPGDNIKMARYIYEQAGKKWTDWSCYTKKMI